VADVSGAPTREYLLGEIKALMEYSDRLKKKQRQKPLTEADQALQLSIATRIAQHQAMLLKL
jgi:hypothetical protein